MEKLDFKKKQSKSFLTLALLNVFLVTFVFLFIIGILLMVLQEEFAKFNSEFPFVISFGSASFAILNILVIIIYRIFNRTSLKNINNLYEEKEKKNFLKGYLISSIIIYSITFASLILITLGVVLKGAPGAIITIIGFFLLLGAFSYYVFINSIRKKYRDKDSVLGDIVKDRGQFANLSILERAILLVVFLAFIIFLTVFLTNGLLVNMILMYVFMSGFFIYNIITTSRCLKRFNKTQKKE